MNTFSAAGDLFGALSPLVDKPPDPSEVGQGWIGFLMFLFLAVATVLLWLSFRRQLKKVNFEEEPDPTPSRTRRQAGPGAGPIAGPGTGSGTGSTAGPTAGPGTGSGTTKP
jgi:hypothetical protein